jgi:hypothetical protein
LKFELYFTEIDEIFTVFNWEYILKYIVDAFPSVFDSVAGLLEEGKKARPAKKREVQRSSILPSMSMLKFKQSNSQKRKLL